MSFRSRAAKSEIASGLFEPLYARVCEIRRGCNAQSRPGWSLRGCLALAVAVSFMIFRDVAVAAPTATLADPTARLEYQATEGRTSLMVLQVDGLDAGQVQDPGLLKNLRDLGSPPEVKLSVSAVEKLPASASARTWLVSITVAGLPANTAQKRYLQLDMLGNSTTLEYTLTNRAVGNFSWTVRAPPGIAIEPGQPIPLTVSVGPVSATGVVLVAPYIAEKTTNRLIAPMGFQLCRYPSGNCEGDNISLAANSAAQLWLRGASGVGRYEGSMTLASAEKPEGDTLNITVFSTTGWLQGLGIVTIFCGALLAWYVTVFGRNLVNRDQMLLPVARFRTRLADLRALLATNPTGAPVPNVTDRLQDLEGGLSDAQLTAAGLPARIPSPWAATPAASQVDAFRTLLQGTADWLAVLETIGRDGFTPVWAASQGATQAQQPVIRAATTDLDAIAKAAVAPALDTVRQLVRAQVNAVCGRNFAGAADAAQPTRSYEQLNLEIARISAVAWVIVLLATTVVGALALVLNNSFGSLTDFITCFAWGLGVPIGGQALTASMGTVGTSLGITMLKSG